MEEYNWEPYDDPQKQSLITQGFPLWLLFWGLLDYHEKLKDMQHQDTDYIAVIQTKAIEPQDIHLPAFVPLDKTFTHGASEWHENHQRTQWDNIHWFPMIHYQHNTIETIGQSGPATAKLGPYKNAELHCEYKFFFKAGGCVPPMDKITDPGKQPTFPIPTNIADPNSLQSPAEPIETFLYTFDERRGQITSTAADRITKDYSTAKNSVHRFRNNWNRRPSPPNIPRDRRLGGGKGSPRKNTIPAAHRQQKQTTAPPKANQAPTSINTTYNITCIKKGTTI